MLDLLLLVFLCLAAHEAGAQEGSYKNEELGYTVHYPAHWFPSGNVYSNAFELRNYSLDSPQSVPERNRGSLIIVDTINESAEVTDRFLDELNAEPPFCVSRLSIDGRRALRVVRRMPAQPLGPGAAQALESDQYTGPRFFFAIDTYIANGRHLISIEARAPVEVDPAVLEDIVMIQESTTFSSP